MEKTIRQCLKGNSRSQEKLYKHYYSYGKSITLRYSKCEQDASELLNDSFFKVFQKLDQYDNSRSFTAWFRRILVNTCIDKYKKRIPVELAHLDSALDVACIDDTLNALEAEEIIYLLQELPHNLRVTFNLYEIEGYSHHEIGQMLEVSTSTSRSNLTRAKIKLRQLLKKTSQHDTELERYSC